MTGREAVDWILGRHGFGNKEGLTNTSLLLEALGHPEKAYRCVHIGGTNGKGSTCSMIDSVLRAAGYKTGLYTSPYLAMFNERIRVDGEPIGERELGEVAGDVRRLVEEMDAQGRRATVFEIITVCGLEFFRRAGVDIAVIEVGLGGRLDSTNVIEPILTAITHIGLDHMAILGDTIEQIAWEKAGIVKAGVPCVLYPQGEPARGVIGETCASRGAQMIDAAELRLAHVQSDARGHAFDVEYGETTLTGARIHLAGNHQLDNVRTALAALFALRRQGFRLEDEAILRGLASARWPGRLDWFGNILLDGAHNEQGARALAAYLAEYVPDKKIVAVCGILRGKAADGIVGAVAPRLAGAHCVSVEGHRAGDPREIAALFEGCGVRARACESVEQALRGAKAEAGEDGVVLVFGSLYLVGTAWTMLSQGT